AERPRRRGPLIAGYFSRISVDKGFGELPAIVAKLRAAGWEIARLDVAGAVADGALLASTVAQLERSHVGVRMRGELDHARTLEAIASADLLLFPSVSSVEGVGRVVVEACGAGTAV